MQFAPKTAEEITQEEKEFAEKNVLPKGEYDFEVMSAGDTVSKKTGNEMVKLKLRVWGPDGKERHVIDYLLAAMEHKLYHFAHAVGIADLYNNGEMDASSCEGRAGRVKLKIETSEVYGTKNVVHDYAMPKADAAPKPTAAPKPARPAPAKRATDPDLDAPEEDDIPF